MSFCFQTVEIITIIQIVYFQLPKGGEVPKISSRSE